MYGIKAADYLFCNEEEAAQFIKTTKMPEDSTLTDVAVTLAKFEKFNKNRPRVVMVTQGP